MGGVCQSKNCGLKLLVEKYRKEFQIPENLNFYSKKKIQNCRKKIFEIRSGHEWD